MIFDVGVEGPITFSKGMWILRASFPNLQTRVPTGPDPSNTHQNITPFGLLVTS